MTVYGGMMPLIREKLPKVPEKERPYFHHLCIVWSNYFLNKETAFWFLQGKPHTRRMQQEFCQWVSKNAVRMAFRAGMPPSVSIL